MKLTDKLIFMHKDVYEYGYREGYLEGVAALTPEIVVTGPLLIDIKNELVELNGTEIDMSPIERRIMMLLAKNLGNYVTSEKIHHEGWPGEGPFEDLYHVNAHRIRMSIMRLRRRIGDTPGNLIRSGYLKFRLENRPPISGEKGAYISEETVAGYSRADARRILTNALKKFKSGHRKEGEALVSAVIEGLPDYPESATIPIGRPNKDQRVIEALRKLGGEQRWVTLWEIARMTNLTRSAAAQSLRRARSRNPEILWKKNMGYRLEKHETVYNGTEPGNEPDLGEEIASMDGQSRLHAGHLHSESHKNGVSPS